MKIVDDVAIFSTGKKAKCKNGIMGINIQLEVSDIGDNKFQINEVEKENLTPLEKIELAEFMINQWTYYKYLAQNEVLNI